MESKHERASLGFGNKNLQSMQGRKVAYRIFIKQCSKRWLAIQV
jgi:hypothetical protein